MPTLEHNALVELFRDDPRLAPHLLEILFNLQLPPYRDVGVVESSLDQLIPVEFRADLVLELRDEAGVLVLAIILEVQRDEAPRKKYAWPVYVAVARAQRECATIVLVVAPDAAVASWAAQPIDLGLGLGSIRPLVLGPATVPAITDQTEAERETGLSVLSAIAHGNGPNGLAVVLAALTAIGRLNPEHAAAYFQIVYNALREPVQRALEALVMQQQAQGKVKFPPFVQQIFDSGELKGELKGKRDTLLRFLSRAGIALTEDERERIRTCEDPAMLDRWVDNVIGAKTAADIFA